MKNLLLIAATAIFATVAGAAHAAPVNFGGSVTPSCTMTVGNGALSQIANSLQTTTLASAMVTCNSNNTVSIVVDPLATQSYNGTATTSFTGGNGVYTNASGTLAATTTPTSSAGDTVFIGATIAPTVPTQLLEARADYNVVVDVTLTPQ